MEKAYEFETAYARARGRESRGDELGLPERNADSFRTVTGVARESIPADSSSSSFSNDNQANAITRSARS